MTRMTRMTRMTALVGAALVVAGALLWAGAASASGGPDIRTVEITARWSQYTPAVIRAKRGTVLRLVVRNIDPIDHELIVGDQAVQDRHELGTQAHHDAPGEVSVTAHSVVVTWWRVTGNTMFGCHMPGHWGYGMRGAIVAG
jgi:uncharacterized cupredoxin-like copper-binding protein